MQVWQGLSSFSEVMWSWNLQSALENADVEARFHIADAFEGWLAGKSFSLRENREWSLHQVAQIKEKRRDLCFSRDVSNPVSQTKP